MENLQRKQWECEELPRQCADEVSKRTFVGYDILHCLSWCFQSSPTSRRAFCFVKLAQAAMEEHPMEEKYEELDRLTLSRLNRALLKDQTPIVYLCACSTTGMGERPANWMVHITSEFQLKGFSRVTRTLRKSPDEACSSV